MENGLNLTLKMESISKLVTSSDDNSESPCSALLERLKNLRKWQDEQRRELLTNQSGIDHQELMSVEGITRTRVETPPSGLSQSFASSLNEQLTERGVSLENSQSLSMYYDTSSGAVSSSIRLTESDPGEYFSPSHGVLSLEELPQNEMPKISSQKSGETVHEDLISDHEVDHQKNDSQELFLEGSLYAKDFSHRYENDPTRKLQGLSHFINRNIGNRLAVDDDVHNHELKTGDKTAVSQSKPRFPFLRKGGGTSRFGMKSVRLKPKPHKNFSNDCEEDIKKKGDSPKAKSAGSKVQNIIPTTYISKTANRPLRKIQLQDSTKPLVTVTPEIRADGNFDARSDEIGPSKLSRTNIQQDQKLRISECEKQGRKEREELSAFEKLEELADDSSFSSNSSTVIHLLQRGLRSLSSTPVRSPPPTPHLTPIQNLANHMNRDGLFAHQGANVKLTNRMEKFDAVNCQIFQQETQLPLVSVSQILEQLQGIIRLEDIDESSLTQEELKVLIESLIDPDASLTVGSVSHFENNIKFAPYNPTSTPAVLQEALPPKPRVHFRPEGVEVLEYILSESEEENTLTDTPSIAEDTDLITTSDLEILTQVDVNTATGFGSIERKHVSGKTRTTDVESFAPNQENKSSKISRPVPNLESGSVPNFRSRPVPNLGPSQALKLQFSPPRQPPNSASHYIWSIFGNKRPEKDLQGKSSSQNFAKHERLASKSTEDEQLPAFEKVDGIASAPKANGIENQKEVETYKTLLMSKICELEKEMELYKSENSKLRNLQEALQREKYQLDQEKKIFQEEVTREKEKLREYIDTERNRLWKEKQAARQQLHTPSITSVKEQSLEIVYLKEQLHDLQEEAKKKESLHQFALKKLNEKVQMQEEELKLLKVKTNSLQRIEKENLTLKHEVDRMKLGKKPLLNNKPGVTVARRPKMKTKTATISSINKSLDNLATHDAIAIGVSSSRSQPALPRVSSSERLRDLNGSEKLHLNNLKNIDGNELYVSTNIRDKSEEKVPDENDNENDFISNNFESSVVITSQDPSYATQKAQDSPRSPQRVSIDCTEVYRNDGTKEIIYANGNKKEIHPSGLIIISYYNGDRKEVHHDRTVYVYGTDHTSHTTFTDGQEVLEFPNGQKETRFSDGSSEIIFTDNTRKRVLSDGTEVCIMKDGTIVRTNPDGIKVFEFVSGQKEVHTPEQKRREYPDGTVKILHPDGSTETRYKTGRVRIKDKEGNMLTDTHQ